MKVSLNQTHPHKTKLKDKDCPHLYYELALSLVDVESLTQLPHAKI